MSEQIDWSKAPEGATHWEPEGVSRAGWMKLENNIWYFWPVGKWNKYEWNETMVSDKRASTMCARPSTPSWSGEGLPPVGVVCEVRNAPGGWGKATIKYQGKGIIVWLWDRPDGNTDQIEFASCPDRLEFRPIRTPEQIAADERDKAIRAIVYDLQDAENLISLPSIASCLYGKGYRKQEKPE